MSKSRTLENKVFLPYAQNFCIESSFMIQDLTISYRSKYLIINECGSVIKIHFSFIQLQNPIETYLARIETIASELPSNYWNCISNFEIIMKVDSDCVYD